MYWYLWETIDEKDVTFFSRWHGRLSRKNPVTSNKGGGRRVGENTLKNRVWQIYCQENWCWSLSKLKGVKGLHQRKMSAHALLKMTRDLFRAMSLAPRQKYPRNVVEMKEAMAAFSGSDSVEISCHCIGRNFDVSVFSREYSVLKLAKNRIGMVWFSVIDVEIAGLHVEDMPKRWVIFALFVYCMFRATRYKKKL